MKHLLLCCVVLLVFTSCNKKKLFDGPNSYSDGFESYATFENLFVEDDLRWSYTQQTKTENTISLDTNRKHAGNYALKFSAKKSDDVLSKCSISKQKMAFWEGETMYVSVWYFLEGNANYEWLFLLDLEEQASIGAGPGMRLALVDNKLRIEHKYNEKDIIQELGKEIDFPRNQWVNLVWEVKLSQKKKGTVKLWQDGNLLITKENHRTLPKDILYFQQGTKGMYSSVEFGVTANSRDNDINLWLDDVEVKKL